MSIYRCSACGVIENTSCARYWTRLFDARRAGEAAPEPLCSACDPKIHSWHGMFPRESATGYLLGEDGFLYHPTEARPRHTDVVGVISPDGSVRADDLPVRVLRRDYDEQTRALVVTYEVEGERAVARGSHAEVDAALDAALRGALAAQGLPVGPGAPDWLRDPLPAHLRA